VAAPPEARAGSQGAARKRRFSFEAVELTGSEARALGQFPAEDLSADLLSDLKVDGRRIVEVAHGSPPELLT